MFGEVVKHAQRLEEIEWRMPLGLRVTARWSCTCWSSPPMLRFTSMLTRRGDGEPRVSANGAGIDSFAPGFKRRRLAQL